MTRPLFHAPSAVRGLTLIELMISVTIGLLITAGVGQIYLSGKQSFRHTAAQSEVQENGRFAMEFLKRNIRATDFWGCGGDLTSVVNHVDTADAGYDADVHGFAQSVQGIDGGGANSDSIWLRSATSLGASVTGHSSGNFIDTSAPTTISPGDIAFVSDCVNADLFYVARINTVLANTTARLFYQSGQGSPGNTLGRPNLSNYGADAKLFSTEVMFVSVGNDPVTGDSSLLRSRNGSANEVYVSNVENMQIEYGIDQNADEVAERYATGAVVEAAALWDQVISVRVAVLVASTAQVRDDLDTNTYDLLGVTIDPVDDRRLRQIYTTSIIIRNRVS